MCHECFKWHHKLSHINRQNQEANDDMPTTGSSTADAQGLSNAEVNTDCTSKGKLKNHILLATVIVKDRNKFDQYVPCRALLDRASQSHNRKMCTNSEVITGPNTCIHTGH